MSTVDWHRGPPPAVGWWPASYMGDLDCWRWWGGHEWSCVVGSSVDSGTAEMWAERPAPAAVQHSIRWRDWPEHMRHLPGYPLRRDPAP